MKWEYRYCDISLRSWQILEEMGDKKWELVCVDHDIAYFKRPKESQTIVGHPIRIDETLDKDEVHFDDE